jgi:hypothetical protein
MKAMKLDCHPAGLIERRAFLGMAGAVVLAEFLPAWSFGGIEPRYKLAPESLLPDDIRRAPAEAREAYRFAIANRDTLRYIPCYCGCVEEGHTSNASCYLKDSSTPGNLVFDRMSLN